MPRGLSKANAYYNNLQAWDDWNWLTAYAVRNDSSGADGKAMSDIYRKYAKYPLIRQRRYRWRMNHDAWCWVLVLVMIAVFVVLEWVR